MKKTFLLLWLVLEACNNSGSNPRQDAGERNLSDPSPINLSSWTGLGLDESDGGTLTFISELTKASLGEAADLDSDGQRELSALTLADGARVWVWTPEPPHDAFRIDQLPNRTRRYTYYYSNYAFPRIVDEYTAEKRVTVFDDLNNGSPNRRRTQTTVDAGVLMFQEETSTNGKNWVDAGTYLARSEAEQIRPLGVLDCGLSLKGTGNFPEGMIPDGQPRVGFSDASEVKCNPDQHKKVAKAFECVKEKLDGCMKRVNPTLRNRIISRLITDGLLIGCNNPCGNSLATTTPGTEYSAGRMNFNPTRLANWSDSYTCGVMLHEMTHLTGEGFGDEHDKGLDQTYACGNYCGGCQNVGPYGAAEPFTPPPSQNENCARCADTEAERRKCGTKTKLAMNCSVNYTLCHGTIGTNKLCESCEVLETKDCTDREVAPPRFDCCAACPADANRLNDKPCPGPLMESDSCNMPPPECQ